MPARKCGTCDVEVRDQVAICRRCESELRRRLVDQPEHRAQLELELRRETRKHELLKAANLEWRIPFNDAASELIRDQAKLIGGWVASLAKLTPPILGPACDRACTHRSCNIVRRDRPPTGELRARSVWLAGRVGMLRRRPEVRAMLEAFRRLDRDIITLVDLPANRQRIHVGPCPEMRERGYGPEHCPGQVDAVFPLDNEAPCHMECSACGERWPSWQWNRTGSRILARAEQLEAQQQLAKTIGGAA